MRIAVESGHEVIAGKAHFAGDLGITAFSGFREATRAVGDQRTERDEQDDEGDVGGGFDGRMLTA